MTVTKADLWTQKSPVLQNTGNSNAHTVTGQHKSLGTSAAVTSLTCPSNLNHKAIQASSTWPHLSPHKQSVLITHPHECSAVLSSWTSIHLACTTNKDLQTRKIRGGVKWHSCNAVYFPKTTSSCKIRVENTRKKKPKTKPSCMLWESMLLAGTRHQKGNMLIFWDI